MTSEIKVYRLLDLYGSIFVTVRLWGSVPGSVMKLRRAWGLNEWRAGTGRSVRSIAFDMVLAGQLSWNEIYKKKYYAKPRAMAGERERHIKSCCGGREVIDRESMLANSRFFGGSPAEPTAAHRLGPHNDFPLVILFSRLPHQLQKWSQVRTTERPCWLKIYPQ